MSKGRKSVTKGRLDVDSDHVRRALGNTDEVVDKETDAYARNEWVTKCLQQD